MKKALTPLDKQYWKDLKKLKENFIKEGKLAGVVAADAEIKKVLADYKKREVPKEKAAQAEVAKLTAVNADLADQFLRAKAEAEKSSWGAEPPWKKTQWQKTQWKKPKRNKLVWRSFARHEH